MFRKSDGRHEPSGDSRNDFGQPPLGQTVAPAILPSNTVPGITRPMRVSASEELHASIASARYPALRPVYDSLAQAGEAMQTTFSPGSEASGRLGAHAAT
jgi:hypothetical protein